MTLMDQENASIQPKTSLICQGLGSTIFIGRYQASGKNGVGLHNRAEMQQRLHPAADLPPSACQPSQTCDIFPLLDTRAGAGV